MRSLPSFTLSLLYVYAAASKLLDTAAFRHQLHNQAFPHWLADILLYALPVTELSVVALLAFARTQLKGLWLSLILLLVFTGYITLVLLHFWDRVPCSCGGILSRMGWGTHLVFNLCMIAVNIIAIALALKEDTVDRFPIKGMPKTL